MALRLLFTVEVELAFPLCFVLVFRGSVFRDLLFGFDAVDLELADARFTALFFFLKLDFGLDLILDLDLDLSLDLDLDFGLFFADEVFLACVLGLDLPVFWSLLPTEVDVDVALIFGFFPIFMLFFHLMKDFFGIFEHASKLRNMK